MVDDGGQRCGAASSSSPHRATDAALSEPVAALATLTVVQSITACFAWKEPANERRPAKSFTSPGRG